METQTTAETESTEEFSITTREAADGEARITVTCAQTGRRVEHLIRSNAISFNRHGLIESMKRTLRERDIRV